MWAGNTRVVCEWMMCQSFLNQMKKWRWLGNIGLESDFKSMKHLKFQSANSPKVFKW